MKPNRKSPPPAAARSSRAPVHDEPSNFAQRWRIAGAAAALFSLAIVAHAPALRGDLRIFDDEPNITNNVTLRTAAGLRRIWGDPTASEQYYPLTDTMHWVEYQLWELRPLGFHLVNLLLHGVCVLLAWRVLLRLEVPGAWLAAALFAVHPVEVESVAWVTERKNLLSMALALASLLCYLRSNPLAGVPAVQSPSPSWLWYSASLALFALALLSKTAVVSLPVVLLVLSWWKLGTLDRRTLVRTTPFFVLSLAAGLITMWVESQHVSGQPDPDRLNTAGRVLVSGRALWFYASSLAWPASLMFFYPKWSVAAGEWWQWLFPLGALALVGALWWGRTRIGRGPLAAVLIYVVVLGPALGFIDIAYMRWSYVADHFQYHASLALFALFASGIAWLASQLRPTPAAFVRITAAGLVVSLGTLTFLHAQLFENPEVLYRDNLRKNPSAVAAYVNLGAFLDSQGRQTEAIEVFQQALEYDDAPRIHFNIGQSLLQLGEQRGFSRQLSEEAISHLRAAIALDDDFAVAHRDLGYALLKSNQPELARQELTRAVKLNADDALAVYYQGLVSLQMGQAQQAVVYYQQAIEIDPGIAQVRFSLANVQAQLQELHRAVENYRRAIELRPDFAAAMNNLGVALMQLGETEQGIAQFRAALDCQPDYSEARSNLERALSVGASTNPP